MRHRLPALVAVLFAVAAFVPGAASAASPLSLTPPPGPVVEGSLAEVTAAFDTTAGTPARFRFGWGDDTYTLLAATSSTMTAGHAYRDEGTYDLRVRVTLAGGATLTVGLKLVVENAPPVLGPLPDIGVPLGEPFTLDVGFSDPGAADRHDVTVDWGDGSVATLTSVAGNSAQFTHTYAVDGSFPVLVTVNDGDGGVASDDFTASVVPFCGGLPVTLDAAGRPQPITGTPGADVILGTEAADTINALGGNDVVCGGGGDDVIDGGRGNDVLFGEGGRDTLVGGPGDDILRGGRGDDELLGGPGADALGGGLGADRLSGGDGGDVLHGGTGRDDLTGGAGSDLLFRDEYPSRDRMNGGPDTGEEDVVDTGKRGTFAAGIRRYLTEDEALAFQGSYLLGEFTTYHKCCEDRVVNIQLMADTVGGHVALPGEVFSVNGIVGERTAAKGYRPAGAIIGGYVQCCDHPANMGGGTSQFGTTIYNAAFFAGLEDIEHQPHSLDFARYPDGREATMGWPHPDVAFRNDTDHPILVTTHHAGMTSAGTYITVRVWGDNGGIEVSASDSGHYNIRNTTAVIYEGDRSLSPGQQIVKYSAYAGYTIDVYRHITYPGGRTITEPKFTWTYQPHPKVVKVHPCEVPRGMPDYTGESCPGGGGNDNDPDPPVDPV